LNAERNLISDLWTFTRNALSGRPGRGRPLIRQPAAWARLQDRGEQLSQQCISVPPPTNCSDWRSIKQSTSKTVRTRTGRPGRGLLLCDSVRATITRSRANRLSVRQFCYPQHQNRVWCGTTEEDAKVFDLVKGEGGWLKTSVRSGSKARAALFPSDKFPNSVFGRFSNWYASCSEGC